MKLTAFLVLALSACAHREAGRDFQPAVSQPAQIQWIHSPTDRLILDGTFARDTAGTLLLTAGKESAAGALLRLEIRGDRVTASGPLIGRGWQGLVYEAPERIQPWLALLQAWKARPEGKGARELHTGTYRARYEYENNRWIFFSVVCNDTGTQFGVSL